MLPRKPTITSQPQANGTSSRPPGGSFLPPALPNHANQPQSARVATTEVEESKLVALTAKDGGAQTARNLQSRENERARVMTGTEASKAYWAALSEHERSEILDFDDVHYHGQNCLGKIAAPVAGKPNFGYDDDRGDLLVVAKDHVAYRFEILSVLGKGSFGQVVKALDHKTGQHVALKAIRNKKRFHAQAEVEVKVLKHLQERDPEGKYGIVKMIEALVFRNHVCIIYELLSINLYEQMKLNKFQPMPLPLVKKIAASLLISLAFMWRENIIHCDLKPENILLRQPNRTAVKVIDLGSACFENERVFIYIQSRFYRAPEVILELGYSKRIDLWSYACVLAELASGYPLFAGENETEQLACIMEVLGVPPKYLIEQSPRKGTFFNLATMQPILVPNSRKKVREPSTKSLAHFVGLPDDDPFVNFLVMFLQYDPDDRPAPEAAMRHPWICDAYVGVTPKVPVATKKSRGSTVHSSAAADQNSNPTGQRDGEVTSPRDRRHNSSISNGLSDSVSTGNASQQSSSAFPVPGNGVMLPDIFASAAHRRKSQT